MKKTKQSKNCCCQRQVRSLGVGLTEVHHPCIDPSFLHDAPDDVGRVGRRGAHLHQRHGPRLHHRTAQYELYHVSLFPPRCASWRRRTGPFFARRNRFRATCTSSPSSRGAGNQVGREGEVAPFLPGRQARVVVFSLWLHLSFSYHTSASARVLRELHVRTSLPWFMSDTTFSSRSFSVAAPSCRRQNHPRCLFFSLASSIQCVVSALTEKARERKKRGSSEVPL